MAQLDGLPVRPADLAALGLVNYGHFTSMRVERGAVRGLTLHLERLVRDCQTVFDADLDADRIRVLVRQAAEEAGDPVTVRVTVYDPGLDLARAGARAAPRILVTTRIPLPPDPSALQVSAIDHTRALAHVKHTGLFDTVHHRRAAQQAGFDDVLFAPAGQVCEGATWNVGFIAPDGTPVWPLGPALTGVTAALLDSVCPNTERRPLMVGQLRGMEAAFAVNAAVGVRAIGLIDQMAFPGEHPAITRLCNEYARIPGEPL